jgi:hypothetical protein
MLRTARRTDTTPALATLLCEKAYELGAKDLSGYPTALSAMRTLAAKVPALRMQALQWTVALCQRQYTLSRGEDRLKAAEGLTGAQRQLAQAQEEAGDVDAAAALLRQGILLATNHRLDAKAALQAQLAEMTARHQAARQLAALKAKLQANPTDAASRKELVRMCLVELNDPAQAAAFLDESLDPATCRYVPAAARGVDAAPELACVALGDWFRGLVDQALTPAGKVAVLSRAMAYYNRFLSLHAAQDAAKDQVAQAVKKVETDLAALGVAAPAGRPRRLLIFTLARGNVHASTPAAIKVFQEAGRRAPGFESTVSEDAASFNGPFLSRFDAVCLLNCSGEVFPDESARQALLAFVRGGKGLAVIHASAAANAKWPEYADMIGAGFAGSPFRRVSVKLDDPASPLNAPFAGKGFEISDELYSFKDPYSRDKVHVLLTVDVENTGAYLRRRSDRADRDYALSWVKTCGAGRVFVTAIGHDEAPYTSPAIGGHILAGIRFALGDLKADTTPSAALSVTPVRGPVLGPVLGP